MLSLADIRIRDPFVVPVAGEGAYYLFGTTDPEPWQGPGTGFDCYRSTDLEHWEGPIPAFRPPAGFWGTTQFWAPEVHPVDGGYVMLATFAGESAHRGTQALRAERPEGPYLPQGDGPLTPREWECLDGTLWWEDGQPWLVYCHEWTQIADGTVVAQRLTADLGEAVGEPHELFAASSAPWALALRDDEGAPLKVDGRAAYVTDGPWLFHEEGELRMLWSSLGEQGYATGVAVSETGSVLGPWRQLPEPMWAADGGHAMLFHDGEGRRRIALHQPNTSPLERAVLPVLADLASATAPTAPDE